MKGCEIIPKVTYQVGADADERQPHEIGVLDDCDNKNTWTIVVDAIDIEKNKQINKGDEWNVPNDRKNKHT